ncbi:MAG: hypothetical protein AB7W16_26940 [Candidatus Obscuribacterales bacterium]
MSLKTAGLLSLLLLISTMVLPGAAEEAGAPGQLPVAEGVHPAASAPAPAPANSGGLAETSPGPLQGDRKKVHDWLLAAKKRGVGIKPYLGVYDKMEASVRAGEPEEKIRPQLDSLLRAISDQYKASRVMQSVRVHKTRRGRAAGSIPDDSSSYMGYKDHIRSKDDIARACERAELDALLRLPPEIRQNPDVRKELRRKREDRRRSIYGQEGYHIDKSIDKRNPSY